MVFAMVLLTDGQSQVTETTRTTDTVEIGFGVPAN